MKQYLLSALTLITLLPGSTFGAAVREQEPERSLISVPAALSNALKSVWNTANVGGWVYIYARSYYAAIREYERNCPYWDTLFNGSAEECKRLHKQYTPGKVFTQVKDAFLTDLLPDDAKIVKNCTFVAAFIASLASAVYYLDKAASVDDLPSYTDGTDHAQARLEALADTHENAYFTYYGARAHACKKVITQLKKELAALDQQEFADNNYRISTLHKEGTLARWYTRWLFSGAADIINEDGTLNVPVLENLLAQRAAAREQRREELPAQLAQKRLELQECMKNHLLEQQMPSQYSASLGAGLASLATLVGSGYALAKINDLL